MFLKGDLDKVLCRMRKSLIFATLYGENIIFQKESFINAKKVLNFIQSLINENLIKSYKVLIKSHKESNKALNIIPYNYVR